MDYQGTTFSGGLVRLDGNRFIDCVFDGAVLCYDGGPIHIVGCNFKRIAGWRFGGALGTGLDMLGRLKGAPLLDGFRGSEPVDREALADILCRVSELVADQAGRIAELDINPLICAGGRIVAVDALIVPARK